ncbi:MAG: 50S ribosomal protein L6 [Cyclobacteriaceae bacterium]|nr:50S ribosomal protein L6 [Cyclobacteriaceae bacterium]
MSRIGKSIINVPSGVTCQYDKNSGLVTVKGAKGELTQLILNEFDLEITESTIEVKRPTEQKRHKALHGLYRSLINNMVVGVSEGYKAELELRGVGYKATATGNTLELSLGYSHNIYVGLPPEIVVSAETAKGKSPVVTLESIDKQLLGQMAAKIKSLRKVEPYKGKGIRFVNEFVRKKAGKQAAK